MPTAIAPATASTPIVLRCFVISSIRSVQLFRRDEIAPLRLFDRDKGVVAVLVFCFPIVALLTYALDDIELTRALTEEDPRGPPGLGEDLRRSNIEIDVEDVLVGEIDAFNDVHIAIVRHADRLADRKRRLRQDVDRIDDKRVAFPMTDRMAVKSRVWRVGMLATVGVDTAQPIAVGFA